MNNIQTYEGFRNKLATLALGGALALGATSCGPERIKNVEMEQIDENSKDFNYFKIKTNHFLYKIIMSKNKKVLTINYTVNRGVHVSIYVADDRIDEIYVKKTGFIDCDYFATDIPQNDNKFKKINFNELYIIEETDEYKIVGTRWAWETTYVLINKNLNLENAIDVKLGDTNAKLIELNHRKFIIPV